MATQYDEGVDWIFNRLVKHMENKTLEIPTEEESKYARQVYKKWEMRYARDRKSGRVVPVFTDLKGGFENNIILESTGIKHLDRNNFVEGYKMMSEMEDN